jgi:hypothetical protein
MSYEWIDDEALSEAEDTEAGLFTVFGEELEYATPEEVEERVWSAASRLTPAQAESLAGALRDVGRYARQAAPTVLPVAGGIVGTVYGGPAGAAIGSQIGGVAGRAIGGQAAGPRPPAPAAPAAAAAFVAQVPAQPAAPISAAPPASPAQPAAPAQAASPAQPAAAAAAQAPGAAEPSLAAGQLLHLVENPLVKALLLQLAMGAKSGGTVPVAGKEVPAGGVMNLLGTLAGRAAEDADALFDYGGEGLPEYLMDDAGSPACDPAAPSQRADVLLRLFDAEDAALDEW